MPRKPKETSPIVTDCPPVAKEKPAFIRSKKIDYDNPDQLYHIAAKIFNQHHMNYTEAFREMYPSVSYSRIEQHVAEAKKNEKLQARLQAMSEEGGLGKAITKFLIDTCVKWIKGSDKTLQVAGMKVLGGAALGEKLTMEKPETLSIEGLEEGVTKMKLYAENSEEKEKDDGPTSPSIQ